MEPEDMTLEELIDSLERYCNEHDLDCEEEGPRDRCTACLAREAKKKYKEANES